MGKYLHSLSRQALVPLSCVVTWSWRQQQVRSDLNKDWKQEGVASLALHKGNKIGGGGGQGSWRFTILFAHLLNHALNLVKQAHELEKKTLRGSVVMHRYTKANSLYVKTCVAINLILILTAQGHISCGNEGKWIMLRLIYYHAGPGIKPTNIKLDSPALLSRPRLQMIFEV